MIYFVGKSSIFSDFDSTIASSTVVECIDYLKKLKSIAVDTETSGLDIHSKKMLVIAVGDNKNQWVIDARTEPILLLKEVLENKLCLAQNAKFDYKFLKKTGITIEKWYDTMLAEVVLDCGRKLKSYSLEAIAKDRLSVILNKEIRSSFYKMKNEDFLTKNQILYSAADVAHLHNIKSSQSIEIKKAMLEKTIALENSYLCVLGDIEYNGFSLDVDSWVLLSKKNLKRLYTLELLLDKELLSTKQEEVRNTAGFVRVKNATTGKYELEPLQYNLFENNLTADRYTDVNWASEKQVLQILIKVFNIFPKDLLGNLSTDSKVLQSLINTPKIINLLLQHRELAKVISTYGENFVKNYIKKGSNKIYSSYWQIVSSGRVSSGDKDDKNKGSLNWNPSPNMQNIPSEHRALFKASEGNKLIIGDFSQQEIRVLADKSQDPYLLDLYLTGDGDSHSLMASKIFTLIEGKEITVTKKHNPFSKKFKKDMRYVGKQVNLSLNYGASAKALSKQFGCTLREAKEVVAASIKAFPIKESYFQRQISFVLKNGYAITDSVTNRKSYIHHNEWSEYNILKQIPFYNKTYQHRKKFKYIEGHITRIARNRGIQGTSASMTKLAGIYIREKFVENPSYKAKLLNVIHDEYVVECPEQYSNAIAKIMKSCMIRAGNIFCRSVSMKIEPIISNNWSK